MNDVTFIEDLDACPKCGAQWAYEVDGHRYSHLGGVYSRERDRTIGWVCPGCSTRWARDAIAPARPGLSHTQENAP